MTPVLLSILLLVQLPASENVDPSANGSLFRYFRSALRELVFRGNFQTVHMGPQMRGEQYAHVRAREACPPPAEPKGADRREPVSEFRKAAHR